jgi:hypothetical protein
MYPQQLAFHLNQIDNHARMSCCAVVDELDQQWWNICDFNDNSSWLDAR